MSLSTLLAKITNRQVERRKLKDADWQKVVAQICDQHEPDADHVEQLMRDLQKTEADLEADVERRRQRKLFRARWQKLGSTSKEQISLKEKLASEEATLQAAIALYEIRSAELNARLAACEVVERDAAAAGAELRKTYTSGPLLEKLAALNDRRRELGKEQN